MSKKLTLTPNWHIEFDGGNNVILVYSEEKVRETKDKVKETYISTDNYYYPNLKSALRTFQQKSLEGAETVQEVLERISEVETIIKNLKF